MNVVQEWFKKARDWLVELWKKTEKRDKTRFFVISGIALLMLIGALVMLSSGRWVVLVENADSATLSSVTRVLEENGIPSRIGDNGSSVLVDRDKRSAGLSALSLNESVGNEVNYNIYEAATGLTSTESERRTYSVYQTETHLKQTLELSPLIANAWVKINMPDNSGVLFPTELRDATASVTVTPAAGVTLSRTQVDGMAAMVAASAGLDAANVIVMDSVTLRHLNEDEDLNATTRLRNNYAYLEYVENSINGKMTSFFTDVLGAGNFTSYARISMDFDDVSSEETVFTPVVDEDGIVRSMQTVEESAYGKAYVNGTPGTDENGLGDTYAEVDDSDISEYQHSAVTTNYEINEFVEKIQREKGRITDITVGLVIDSSRMADANTATDFQSLAAAVVGLGEAEKHKVIVSFDTLTGLDDEQANIQLFADMANRERLFELVRIIVLYVIIALCVVLLVWRTVSLFRPKVVEVAPEQDYLVGDLAEYGELVEAAVSNMEIEMAKSASRERVEEFIDGHPEAVALMLRNWLNDDERW